MAVVGSTSAGQQDGRWKVTVAKAALTLLGLGLFSLLVFSILEVRFERGGTMKVPMTKIASQLLFKGEEFHRGAEVGGSGAPRKAKGRGKKGKKPKKRAGRA